MADDVDRANDYMAAEIAGLIARRAPAQAGALPEGLLTHERVDRWMYCTKAVAFLSWTAAAIF